MCACREAATLAAGRGGLSGRGGREDSGGGGHNRRRHSEQRSGVVTATATAAAAAATFKPAAFLPPCRPAAAAASLRRLAQHVLACEASITRLLDLGSTKFLSSPTCSSFDEECELVITILYMAMSFPGQCNLLLIKGVVADFFERWFEDGGSAEFSSLIHMLKCEWKCSAVSTLLLLRANLLPPGCDIVELRETLTWEKKWFNTTTPVWLMDAAGCTEDVSALNGLLFYSAMMLGGDTVNVDFEGGYIGSTVKFLHGSQLYKKGNFEESLNCLHCIPQSECGADLQGWIFWLTGLCLLKLGKPHTALLKLQAAVDKSQKCVSAIYNIAQVFYSLDLCSAELETLSLLMASGEEEDSPSPLNLQASILALHHTPVNLSLRAHYLLASRCLQLKMYKEAKDKFTLLLENLEGLCVPSSTRLRTLLRPEDEAPEVPTYECVSLLAAVTHMTCNESKNALRVLSKFKERNGLDDNNFYNSSCELKVSYITTAAACLVRTEALAKIGEVKDALKECIRLEQAMSWVSGAAQTEWDVCILVLKTRLYRTLWKLHHSEQNQQNELHYKRLTTQCLNLLGNQTSSPSWQDVSLSNKLAMDNIYFHMRENLEF
ncbi:uncharacterized protein [Cherax quadricarinatus]